VKPAFDDFVLPSKKYADLIIPRGGDNHVAIDLIVQHIHTKLGQHDLCKIYPNVYVIQSTFQVCLLYYFPFVAIMQYVKLILVVFSVFARECKTYCVNCVSGNILMVMSSKQTDYIQ
jgi:hypothetical protein